MFKTVLESLSPLLHSSRAKATSQTRYTELITEIRKKRTIFCGTGPTCEERSKWEAEERELFLAVEENPRTICLLADYEHLEDSLSPGIYVLPDPTLEVWYGVIFIVKGGYQGGCYRFRLDIPHDYPDARPSAKFTPPIFHPLVSASGDVDLSVYFPDWKPGRDYLVHILNYLRAILLQFPSSENPTNQRAVDLFHNDRQGYSAALAECVEQSCVALTDASIESTLTFDTTESDTAPTAVMHAITKACASPNADFEEQTREFIEWFQKQYQLRESPQLEELICRSAHGPVFVPRPPPPPAPPSNRRETFLGDGIVPPPPPRVPPLSLSSIGQRQVIQSVPPPPPTAF